MSLPKHWPMQPLPLPFDLNRRLVELGAEEWLCPRLITRSVNDTLGQRLRKDMRYRTKSGDVLFDEGVPCRHDLLVLALVPTKQNLHGEAVTPPVALGVADDPEIDILPAENLQLGIVPPLVQAAAHPTLLRTTSHTFVRLVFHVRVRVRVLSSRLQELVEVWWFGVDQLVLSTASVHGKVADSSVVESVQPDVEMRRIVYPEEMDMINEEIRAHGGLGLGLSSQLPFRCDENLGVLAEIVPEVVVPRLGGVLLVQASESPCIHPY